MSEKDKLGLIKIDYYMNKGLIFIPDISGFTEFVTSTEIRHSNHITRELIEVILDSNNLDLKVSEIEGDAVLFYKQKDVPTFTELAELIKHTFINFHSYLKVIERDRVCQCGACSTASNLSLKFIVHYGEYNVVPIQTFAKLMGSDVILAHRLLKNSIEANEYSLFTDNYLSVDKSVNSEDNKLTDFSPFNENIESFGPVTGLYNKLEELKKNIPPAVKIKRTSSISGSPDIVVNIEAPLGLVHELLTDNEKKLDFVPGIKEVRGDDINRLNATHTCIFDDLEIHFVTTENNIATDIIEYSEQADAGLGFKITTGYKLITKGESTELSVFIREDETNKTEKNFFLSFFNKVKMKMVLTGIIKQNKKGIALFKKFCEETALKI